MILSAIERFTLRQLLADVGLTPSEIALDQARCLDRKETGVGFISVVEFPDGMLDAASRKSASKTFKDISGQLFLLDLFIRNSTTVDIEGVTLMESWPADLDCARLVED